MGERLDDSVCELLRRQSSLCFRQLCLDIAPLRARVLERLDDCSGPLVVIDEAENLYRGGTRRAERRTALRSLAFYCGGTLPRACVVLAVTPQTLEALREECEELFEEVEAQRTVLAWEDVTMLRRRLLRSRPLDAVKLDRAQLAELGERVRQTHARARGKVADPGFDDALTAMTAGRPTPRQMIKDVVVRLEALRWLGAEPPPRE